MRHRRFSQVAGVFVSLIVLACVASPVFAGAPLKGVDVKLGRNPGGSALRTLVTDGNGVVHLGVLARGSYYVELVPKNAAAATSSAAIGAGDIATVKIEGAAGGSVSYRVDRKSGSIVLHDRTESARTAAVAQTKETKMKFDSDGAHEVNVTVVKSKSNITNNRAE